jgi:hypothetical protein
VGEQVDVEFALGSDPSPVRVHGRAVRQAGGTNYGIEFTDVEPEVAARLRGFLDDSQLEQV